MNHRIIVAALLTTFLYACTAANQDAVMKANDAVMQKINSYCDAIDAHDAGEAGAAP